MKLKVSAGFGTKTVYLPALEGEGESDYWIKLKEVTQGDIARYRNLGKKITYIPRENEAFAQEQDIPSGDLMYARAELCVTEWNLDDENGKVVPVCRAAWDQLPPEWADFIDRAIREYNPEIFGESKNRR